MNTEYLKLQVKIEDVIAQTTTLRVAANRAYGLCPFHADQRRSLVVYLDTQTWWCFACNTGGDVITWLMRLHGWTFHQTVEALGGNLTETNFNEIHDNIYIQWLQLYENVLHLFYEAHLRYWEQVFQRHWHKADMTADDYTRATYAESLMIWLDEWFNHKIRWIRYEKQKQFKSKKTII